MTGTPRLGVGPSAERISENQADDLETLMSDVNADRERFKTHFKVDSVRDLPVIRLKEAIALLEAKRGQR